MTTGSASPVDGVTHYQLTFVEAGPPTDAQIAPLREWFVRLRALGVIGRDPTRYDGVGFGNLSLRHPHRAGAFLITATQLGDRGALCAHDFSLVSGVDTTGNAVVAHGTRPPSSEAMTHAQCYAAQPAITAVFHVHAPELWRAANKLDLATTSSTVAYGTPAMAAEVARLLADGSGRAAAARFGADQEGCALLAMGGHEDGIIATAPAPTLAGAVLLRALAAASAAPRVHD